MTLVMTGKVTPMGVRLLAAAYVEGEEMDVAARCRAAGVSRKTFYKWVNRYRADGAEGLADRSRRPRRSPQQVSVEVEDAVVRWRKELGDAGLDHGATTIQWHLGRDDRFEDPVPSVATIHRVLVRRGLVVPQPTKRPKSGRRFEAAAPNELWQIDSMDWVIATGPVAIFNIIDDHSRVVVRSRAVPEATSDQAWLTFGQAAQGWGLPAGVLSDNGLAFSGKIRGFEVYFEACLRDAGVQPRTGRPYHPQTTGKVERFQQTLKKWLRRQRLAGDLDELQAQLDTFAHLYNHHRPHQGIRHQIPIRRWKATAPATAGAPLAHPERHRVTDTVVNAGGDVRSHGLIINVGIEWEGQPALVHLDGRYGNVFVAGRLVRHFTIDHTRAYQPSGRKRGGPRKPRLGS